VFTANQSFPWLLDEKKVVVMSKNKEKGKLRI